MPLNRLHFNQDESYYFSQLPNLSVDFALMRIAYQVLGKDFVLEHATRQNFLLLLVLKGTLYYRTGKREFIVARNQAIAINRQTHHHIHPHSTQPPHILRIAMTGNALEALFKQTFKQSPAPLQLQQARESIQLGEMILEACRQPNLDQQDYLIQLTRAFLLSLKRNSRGTQKKQQASEQTFIRIRSIFEQRFSEPITLENIAHQSGLSYEYITRLFQRYESKSPGQYLMDLKINKALELLQSDELTIQEIAEQIGYSDPFTFSKAFKRYIGTAPTHYRKSISD